MAEAVLDSSAILAVLFKESGRNIVLPYLSVGAVCANIIAEVVTKLADEGIALDAAARTIRQLELEVHPVDLEAALAIGALREPTRKAGLSLGDRSCLALAQRLGLPAVTADRAWADVAGAVGVEVRLIR